MKKIVCHDCGYSFSDEYKICPYCGKSVVAPEGKEAEAEAELEEVGKLWREYRYDDSFPILSRLAESGNAQAQYMLGFLYDHPQDGHYSGQQVEYWYKKSAEQGFTPAMFIMGSWYEYSDPQQSAYWYKRAADNGNRQALFRLGLLYEKGGRDFERDLHQAADCYKKVLELDPTYTDARRSFERVNGKLNN